MVKQLSLALALILGVAGAVAQADSKDDLKAAVQKLADSPNYSWTSTTVGGRGGGPQEGKTEKDGYTTLSMQFRDNSFQIVMKGDKVAIKTDSGWKSAAELLSAPADDGGPPPPERFAAMIARNFRTPSQIAMENIDSLQNVQKTDDGYTADLSPESAQRMLTFGRRRPTTAPDASAPQMPQIDVTDAKGTVKITVADGTLSKFEVHLTGTISFNGGEGRDVDRTTTTEIKNVGSTTVDVPDDAKAKLQ